ncbi:MAG: hypothetical protein IME96_06355 [Proteobacteria bacterium]|nr:hypothetical protein [Pseudomonadota bacterium]
MAEKVKEYFKLPGRGLKRGSILLVLGIRARLWRGKDHVLSVLNYRFTEEYKRFYFNDIQAITIFKTRRSMIWNTFFLLIAILFVLLAMKFDEGWPVFFGILAAIFIISLAVNLLLGPTCITHIHTAVSKEELPSLGRLKTAIKTVKMLKPFIERTQGKLNPHDIPEKLKEKMKTVRERASSPAKMATSKYNGKVHAALFYMLLIDCCLTVLNLFYTNVGLSLIYALFFLATSALLITALIKQHESALSNSLKNTSWVTLAYFVVFYVLSYIFFIIFVTFKRPELMNNQWESFKYAASLSPFDNPFLMGLQIFSLVFSFLLGTAGLIQLRSLTRINTVTSGPPASASPNSSYATEENE